MSSATQVTLNSDATSATKSRGNFAWYELMTTNPAAAATFYGTVVGWGTTDIGSPEMPYSTFNIDGVGVAGLMDLPKGAGPIPAWVGYIHVDNTDAYVEKVVAAGGKIIRPATDVPGMLRFAVVTDPQGAAFILFTSDPSMKPPSNRPQPGDLGTIAWNELMATDLDAAIEFYTQTFGWTKGQTHEMGPGCIYQIIESDGRAIGGMATRPEDAHSPYWNYYIQVDSAQAAVSRLESAGGKLTFGPYQVPGGSWVVLATDPQGANFALVSSQA
jgi:predicted enzyme related to lactoylglutathione lyase